MANKDMTLGFKLLSAYYIGGISKADVASLAKEKEINWGYIEFESKINQMKNELLKSDTFKFWSSWKKSLLSMTSQAVAINFIVVTLKDWERKGMPANSSSSAHKSFIKNSLITFDQLVYEYITNQWKGSSDSRIKGNLIELETKDNIFPAIPKNKWIELVEEVFQGRLNGKEYSNTDSVEKKIKLLLLYYYTISEIGGPDFSIVDDYDFDHIISKSEIKQSSSHFAKKNVSNIFNIAALPKRDNILKNDKPLNRINETWLKQQIEKYSEIPVSRFDEYSHPSSMEELYEFRLKKFKDAFDTNRTGILG
ncbi:hypothetical protein LIV42_12630 [Bacillus cereus]|uniref:hypothetical protein n=1 Tax=Bacillus cereus TaxID=1396 RepID=UPI001D092F2B|nr:hypothetical protein [Bacillus cereus]MCB5903108.1 hypothetical protein [Bacillus cereus]